MCVCKWIQMKMSFWRQFIFPFNFYYLVQSDENDEMNQECTNTQTKGNNKE